MNDLYLKSIKVLELPQILDKLAGFAATPAAKERIHCLLPFETEAEIRKELSETTAAKKLTETLSYPSFSGVRDVSESLDRVSRSGLLNMRELLNIASLLRAAQEIKNYSEQEKKVQSDIDYLFNAVNGNKYLEKKISTSIISDEEMADNASDELFEIRRKIRQSGEKARDVLSKIISSSTYQKVLQEPIVTIKQNRFVVPVKSECRSSLPGLVHDISSSGATVFVEPIQVVELNNEIKMLHSKEEQEIERILYELSVDVAGFADKISSDYDILCKLDFIFAKAKYSYEINAACPVITEEKKVFLRNARHPLIDKKSVVPINISIGDKFDTLIITGPNTGGKTVSLKTLGLCIIMAACGLHVPANEESIIPVLDAVYADIGDEQSIAQSLSTFSSHMKTIVQITNICSEKSLVLFDELGAGTDPAEGAALAVAVIEKMRKKGALVAATTHYTELKMYALSENGVINGSCEFDINTLMPTYRLVIGIPGKSNAFAISERLGLAEDIIQHAQSMLSDENKKFDSVIEDLENQRFKMEEHKNNAEMYEQQAKEKDERVTLELQELDKRRREYLEEAKAEAKRVIEQARKEADNVIYELMQVKDRLEHGDTESDLNKLGADIRGRLNREQENVSGCTNIPKPVQEKPIKVGDVVCLPNSNARATVIKLAGADGMALLQAGIMQVKAKQSELIHVSQPQANSKPKKKKAASSGEIELNSRSASVELDLRGMTVDEALIELEQFIDHAIMAKLPSAVIIHGKGTGALRAAVHSKLKTMKNLLTFRLGTFGEGESGVTIVEF